MPRSPAKRGDSKLGGLTGSMRPKRTLGQRVELPSPSVSFELAVPSLGVELHKPLPKPSQFLRREITNLLFKILDLTHTTTSFSGQCSTTRTCRRLTVGISRARTASAGCRSHYR